MSNQIDANYLSKHEPALVNNQEPPEEQLHEKKIKLEEESEVVIINVGNPPSDQPPEKRVKVEEEETVHDSIFPPPLLRPTIEELLLQFEDSKRMVQRAVLKAHEAELRALRAEKQLEANLPPEVVVTSKLVNELQKRVAKLTAQLEESRKRENHSSSENRSLKQELTNVRREEASKRVRDNLAATATKNFALKMASENETLKAKVEVYSKNAFKIPAGRDLARENTDLQKKLNVLTRKEIVMNERISVLICEKAELRREIDRTQEDSRMKICEMKRVIDDLRLYKKQPTFLITRPRSKPVRQGPGHGSRNANERDGREKAISLPNTTGGGASIREIDNPSLPKDEEGSVVHESMMDHDYL